MQRGRGAARPPIGIAFDGDLGHRIDAALAVAMLNGLSARGDARRITLSVSRPSLRAAQLADVISAFYAGRPAGGSQGGVGAARDGMIGMPEGGAPDAAPPLAAVLDRKGDDGAPLYASSIESLVDTAETAILIRNLIVAQVDGNAAIVLAGPATGVVKMLGLYHTVPDIEAKVRELVVALGAYPSGAADPSVTADIAAARKLFAEWPTPIVAVGAEVGSALEYPGASIASDFTWAPPAHPVVDAYRLAGTMPYDAPASALAAVLYAVHPTEGYFGLSEPGTITVRDDGRTEFTPTPEGRHRYLTVDPAQRERVLATYTQTVAAPPQPRGGRGRRGAPPNQQQQQQAPPTPPQATPTPPQATPPRAGAPPAGTPPAGRGRGGPPAR